LDGILGLDFLGSATILDFLNLELVFPLFNASLPLMGANSSAQAFQMVSSAQKPLQIPTITSAQPSNPNIKKPTSNPDYPVNLGQNPYPNIKKPGNPRPGRNLTRSFNFKLCVERHWEHDPSERFESQQL
jgi:hypothetical protein